MFRESQSNPFPDVIHSFQTHDSYNGVNISQNRQSKNISLDPFQQTESRQNIPLSKEIFAESKFVMPFYDTEDDQTNLFNNLPAESLHSGFSKADNSAAKRRKLDFDSYSFGSSANSEKLFI